VAFHLHVSDEDRAYLDGLPLSPDAKRLVSRFLFVDVPSIPDAFRADPANRPIPGGECFLVSFVFLDECGDGLGHRIDFHINDSNAVHGVLLLEYVEHHPPRGIP
jgi:hypothetical protein